MCIYHDVFTCTVQYDWIELMSESVNVLKKSVLAQMHFNLRNNKDFVNQIISCKEWFPPDNYDYTVLKKDFKKSLEKLNKRI